MNTTTKVGVDQSFNGTAEAVPSRFFYRRLLTVSVTNEHND